MYVNYSLKKPLVHKRIGEWIILPSIFFFFCRSSTLYIILYISWVLKEKKTCGKCSGNVVIKNCSIGPETDRTLDQIREPGNNAMFRVGSGPVTEASLQFGRERTGIR